MEYKILGKKVSQLEHDSKVFEVEKINKKLNLVDILEAYRSLYINNETLTLLKKEIKSYKDLKKENFDFKDMERYPDLSRLAVVLGMKKYNDSVSDNDREGLNVFDTTKLPLSCFEELFKKKLFDTYLEMETKVSYYGFVHDAKIEVKELQKIINIIDFETKYGKEAEKQKIEYYDLYNCSRLYFSMPQEEREKLHHPIDEKAEILFSKRVLNFLSNINDNDLTDFINETKKIYNGKLKTACHFYEQDTGKKFPLTKDDSGRE